jgi:alpha-ribazole phosphatase
MNADGIYRISPPDPTCLLRLVLMRHGKPAEETRERCYGRLDVSLSSEGQKQVRNKADLIHDLKPCALYTSPRKRAIESAEAICMALNLQARHCAELCEINFGDFEGITYQEIERRYPGEYQQWMKEPTTVKFPGGESFEEMKVRVLGFLAFLLQAHAGQTVLALSHGGVNRILLADALRLPSENLFRIDQEYAAVNVIDYRADFALVRLMNG